MADFKLSMDDIEWKAGKRWAVAHGFFHNADTTNVNTRKSTNRKM